MSNTRQRVPRVVLSRETIWLVAEPGGPPDYGVPVAERRGRLALSAYALYSDAGNDAEFAEAVVPVLLALSASRAMAFLTIVESVSSFDARFLQRRIEICHELGTATMVEIGERWPRLELEQLLSARASYLRIGAGMMRGAAHDPAKLRELAELSDAARARQLQIVASSRDPAGDAHTLRAARIPLMQIDAPREFVGGAPGVSGLRRSGGTGTRRWTRD